MGLLEEPRYLIKNVCNHFYEMPENTIREQTFCCAGGAGLGNDENMEMRLRGGLPRANAVKYVHEKHGVNLLSCICAIDRAVLSALMEYWVPMILPNVLAFAGDSTITRFFFAILLDLVQDVVHAAYLLGESLEF